MIHSTFAQVHDIPGIMTVLNENLLRYQTEIAETVLSSTGFLIHDFTEEEIKDSILNKNDHLVVVTKEAENILGYTIGYELTNSRPAWFSRLEAPQEIIEMISNQKGLHLRHIAKKPGSGQVGTCLMQFLLDEAKSRHCTYVICKIAQLPIPNKASADFHKKMHFKPVGIVRSIDNTNEVYELFFYSFPR